MWAQALRGFCAAIVLAMVAGCAEPAALRLAAPELPLDREIAERLVVLLDQAGIRVDLVAPEADGMTSIDMVERGDADLAFVSNNASFHARVRAVLPLYATVLLIAHRGDEPRDVVDVLAAETVYAGPAGSASRIMFERATAALGRAPEEVVHVAPEQCAEVFALFAPIQRDIPNRLAPCGAYRLLSLGGVEGVGRGGLVDSLTLMDRQLRPFILPRGTFGALTPEPIVTVAVDKLLVARDGLASADVFDLIDTLARVLPALAADFPAVERISSAFDASALKFIVHDGAYAWHRRDEPDFYERYAGIAEVLATVLFGALSAGYGVLKLYERRRKNRVDEFCIAALAIRIRIPSSDAEQLAAAAKDLLALEENAFRALVDEKLSADEAFRILLTLVEGTRVDIRERQRDLAAGAVRG